MENMLYAEPRTIASASEYNKIVDNVNELGRGKLMRRHSLTPQALGNGWDKVRFTESVKSSPHVQVNANSDTFTLTPPGGMGDYSISATVRLSSNSTGGRGLRISLASNVDATFGGILTPTASGLQVTLFASADEVFTTGTQLSVYTYQNSGGSLSTAPLAAGQAVSLSIRYCGES